jgi:UDP:flavonoid glycosyltransferase YjiC (YdhE family)
MIEDAGAGLTALPEGVASAIRRVLDEPGFASAVQRLAAEIAAMPSAAAVAADLRARFG